MSKPGEPTEEFREAMRKAGIDPDEWLKKARTPQPNLAELLKRKRVPSDNGR